MTSAPQFSSTLGRQLSIGQSLLLVVLVFALAVFCFAPRLAQLQRVDRTTLQWGRAMSFMAQCDAPLRTDVELAMRWRLLPAAVCHSLGLRGRKALIVPLIGIVALLLYLTRTLAPMLPDIRATAACLIVVATSSATLAPLHWMGLNDAWAWLGLLGITFGRLAFTLPIACLLCPWIDERFVLALPIALWARFSTTPGHLLISEIRPVAIRCALWLAPYVIARLLGMAFREHDSTYSHIAIVATTFHGWIEYAPLGWWMAWRAGWVLIAVLVVMTARRSGLNVALVLAGGLVTLLLVIAVLAADMSRSAAIALPLVCRGAVELAAHPSGPRMLLFIAIAQLLIPAMHVTGVIETISFLPVELLRLFQ